MNCSLVRYQRQLKKHMSCSFRTRHTLLTKFRVPLSSFLEDSPDPTYDQLTDAFGPPEQMAKILMESVPEAKQIHYRHVQRLFKIFGVCSAAMFLIFSLYVFWMKQFHVITIYEEAFPTNETYSFEGD